MDIEPSLKVAADLAAAGADWLRRRYPGMAVQSAALCGATAEMLAGAARDADLLVLGNRGRGGFDGAHRRCDGRLGMRPGPIVHTLLHHADCPVAVVPRA